MATGEYSTTVWMIDFGEEKTLNSEGSKVAYTTHTDLLQEIMRLVVGLPGDAKLHSATLRHTSAALDNKAFAEHMKKANPPHIMVVVKRV